MNFWRTPIVVIDEVHSWLAAQPGPSTPPSPVTKAFAELARQVNAAPPDPRGLQPLPDWVTAGPPPGPPNPLLARELRESPDGVLAVRDPRRPTGVRGRPWLVIDAPPGYRTHWRDQTLPSAAVSDWVALIRKEQP
ncbi:hypothetical protein [Amycolatopsis eburnea]|uniref:Uncharacterized protein n=1 Tax=Amycolatopsis eburnea TaxID=2267691 RepID=A0A427TPT5_9PSEU|nr:hypothetical protein [Amycolatopsis eburnea]RSD26379.1 hypothetical protein EIY87_00510 [Amycolatopsis eburnea]